jgi:hypothetical protein
LVGIRGVFPTFSIEQVSVAVATSRLEGNDRSPHAVTAALKLDISNRPLVELATQRHVVGLNFSRKREGDVDKAGFNSWLVRHGQLVGGTVGSS